MKKLWNQRWRPRSGCGSLIMTNFLITSIQANLCRRFTNSPELLLLKIIIYQTTTATSGPPPLISQLFSCCFFLHGPHLFLQFDCFGVDIYIYIYIIICQEFIWSWGYVRIQSPLLRYLQLLLYKSLWQIAHYLSCKTVKIQWTGR